MSLAKLQLEYERRKSIKRERAMMDARDGIQQLKREGKICKK